jgi:hypothetical protein
MLYAFVSIANNSIVLLKQKKEKKRKEKTPNFSCSRTDDFKIHGPSSP